MPQIRVTNKTKELLNKELELHKDRAAELSDPVPSMAYVSEVIVLEGLAAIEKARKRQEKRNEHR